MKLTATNMPVDGKAIFEMEARFFLTFESLSRQSG